MQTFDEKLKLQKENDNRVFQDTIKGIAGAVIGKRLEDSLEDVEITKNAINAILSIYYIKNKIKEIPPEVKTVDERIDYYIRPHGILKRKVVLSKDWYKNAIGPMLTTRKSDGKAVALVPSNISGYFYLDLETNTYIKINKKNQDIFDENAVLFYYPFPLKKLKIKDLFLFTIKLFTVSDVLLYAGVMIATALLGLLSPVFSYLLFGPTIQSQNIEVLAAVGIFMISFALTQTLFGAFQGLINSRLGTKINLAIEAAVMGRILALPTSFFKKYSSGELSQRASYVQSLTQTILSTVVSTSMSSLFSLIYIFQIFSFAPVLAVPAIIITLINILVTMCITMVQIRINRKKMKLQSKESGMSYAMITGIQKIKLAGAEKRTFSRWGKLYAKIARFTYSPPAILKFSSVITSAISLFGSLVMYSFAIYGNVGVANYYAFNTAYGMVSGAFAGLAGIVTVIASIGPTLEMAKPIMDTCPQVTENKKVITKLSGSINIDNVSFRYRADMPLILNNISLKVKPGEYVGVVGETGCGKSTLLRLLLGFEFPQKGAIYYDGNSTEQVELKSLCQNIGVVLQNGKLFIGDIYSNIAISKPDLTLDEAWEAAELAQIADDIRQMPMGMFTHISEGSGGVSGGQKQRLMIARAIASKPKIIMLDESTSALDNITQKNISDAISSLKCTRIVIAHRLSTIKDCDRIIVINKGKIAETGTYDELINKGAIFAELVKRQRLDIEC